MNEQPRVVTERYQPAHMLTQEPGAPDERSGPPRGEPIENGAAPPVKFTPSPFKWRDPKTFPRRAFIYNKHYIRKFLSLTAAQTKTGKSMLSLLEAVEMAVKGFRVWYWNGEDPQEELERRVTAICLEHGIDHGLVEKNLFLDSGRQTPITLAINLRTGAKIAVVVEDALVAALIDSKFDVLVLDPVVSIHQVPENDNTGIDALFKTLGRIADRANVAVEGVHHTRKPLPGSVMTILDVRGGSAIISAARDIRILNRMTETQGEDSGVDPDKRRFYIHVSSDGNLVPPDAGEWFFLKSVGLGNGSGGAIDDQDYIGVPVAWKWPDAFEGVKTSALREAQAAIAVGRWRENSQSPEWAGMAIARVLRLNMDDPTQKNKIKKILKDWLKHGMFVRVPGKDSKGRDRTFIEVGKPATDSNEYFDNDIEEV